MLCCQRGEKLVKIRSENPTDIQTGCLVIPVCEDVDIHSDPAVAGLMHFVENISDFKGRKEDAFILHRPLGMEADRIMFIGLGKSEKIDAECLRRATGKVVKECIRKNIEDMVFCSPDAGKLSMNLPSLLTSLLEGAYLANHLFDHYKQEKKNRPLKEIAVYTNNAAGQTFSDLVWQIETVCSSTIMAREWVSMPPNEKRPDRFVRSIHKAVEKENINITVLDEQTLRKNRMGAILAVGAGSRSRPRMLILDHYARKKGKKSENIKTVVLVGKGVTFDSGGINLKSSSGLEDMKMDMAGAAAVAAILIAMARLKVAYRVIGVIPVVENMVSGDASRPGDIIRTYSGKTVEITNTDAEGRLILIDAMAYAVKNYKPDLMIDLATLTGACVVALGEKIAGVFSPDPVLAEAIVAAGESTHERCWAMPMPDDYKEMMKSDFADMKNAAANRWGGAITAALFLADFVGNTRWAHIDIAGPAYARKEGPYCPAGGTGFGVRLVVETLKRLI
jgi:leucyl aminopeptidase